MITVRHNNGSSCSAGGQRSRCAIRPSQAPADLRSQSSVALDKPRRKERQNSDYLIISERTNRVGRVERSSENKITKTRRGNKAEWDKSANARPVLLRVKVFSAVDGSIETQPWRELYPRDV